MLAVADVRPQVPERHKSKSCHNYRMPHATTWRDKEDCALLRLCRGLRRKLGLRPVAVVVADTMCELRVAKSEATSSR